MEGDSAMNGIHQLFVFGLFF